MILRGRFAPSPTGALHLGNARTALLAWLQVRRAGGRMVMRVEDLDRARVVEGAEARLLEELSWLGLDWDEGPFRQSERVALYEQAADRLLTRGQAFECACSRAEVAAAASAPQGEESARYPGTCRDLPRGTARERARAAGRPGTVLRFQGGGRLSFQDEVRGLVEGEVDDFVIRRADAVAAYQLSVVVDDAAMSITEVLRGDDLLFSTPRQLALYRALALAPPAFAHVPLVLSEGGERLAKRHRPLSIGELRVAGVAAATIVGALAASAGMAEPGERLTPAELVERFDLARLPRHPVVIGLLR